MHTRAIECKGYERQDGLWDIEGELTDTKSYLHTRRQGGRERKPGEPVHHMWLRLTIDLDMRIHDAEAATVRRIFERFTKSGSVTDLVRALRADGVRGKRGRLIDKGYVYQLFRNRVYLGEAVHKGTPYPGEHQAIITTAMWDKVHAILKESPRKRAARRGDVCRGPAVRAQRLAVRGY